MWLSQLEFFWTLTWSIRLSKQCLYTWPVHNSFSLWEYKSWNIFWYQWNGIGCQFLDLPRFQPSKRHKPPACLKVVSICTSLMMNDFEYLSHAYWPFVLLLWWNDLCKSFAHFLFYFYFILFIYFIYLFLAVLGLRCCAWAFSSCGERGLLFVGVRGLLTAVASLVAEHGL